MNMGYPTALGYLYNKYYSKHKYNQYNFICISYMFKLTN